MANLIRSIREAIKNSGLTLNQLADRAGIDQSQLSRFMRNERGLTLTTLEALLDALGLEVRIVKRRTRKVR